MTDLSGRIDGTHQLGFIEAYVIKSVAVRRSAEQISKHFSEYTEEEYSARTIQRMMKGLSGETKNVPGKYQYEESYLKSLPRHPDNAVNYRVNDRGREVIRAYDVPSNLSLWSERDGGFDVSSVGPSMVRPHKCWWREEVMRQASGDGTFGWDDRRAVLVERDIGFDEVEKELPNREQSVRGERIHVKGHRVLLFDSTVLIKCGLSVREDGVFDVLDEWWRARDEIVDWLEANFPIRIRGSPLDVSMPISTQEWGDVRNEFAEWIEENPEFQDDTQNCLFEVKNDDGERIFHVDTSPTDGLGNDLAEAEFPHSQFGAEHIVNLKQAVKWMATLGVRPEDFRAAIWIRDNRDELEKLVELDREELDRDLMELSEAVEVNKSDIEENRARLQDLVGRVDSVGRRQREMGEAFEEGAEEILEEVRDSRSQQTAVLNTLLEMEREQQKLVDRVEDLVEGQSEMLDSQSELLSRREKSFEVERALLREVSEIRRMQYRRSWRGRWRRLRRGVGRAVEKARGFVRRGSNLYKRVSGYNIV